MAWRAALKEAGYIIERTDAAVLDQQLQFSGFGIGNAKIAVSATRRNGRAMIEFDASLRP